MRTTPELRAVAENLRAWSAKPGLHPDFVKAIDEAATLLDQLATEGR